ncbi:MAG: bifunctional 2-C-methyl-D-erythritol 4-phosphate cytidylyltransferase/2-C-methyl-D-erythritol 2,4-cyclodiphosphate synthase [Pseudomonadota bacterium]
MTTSALIVAAGRGTRAAGPESGTAPKQYAMLGPHAVLGHTLKCFLSHPRVTQVLAVIHPDDHALFDAVRDALQNDGPLTGLLAPVHGGATRQASVRAGLQALGRAAVATDHVLIHDAARPFITAQTITRIIDSLDEGNTGCIPALAVADTLKRTDGAGAITATIARDGLWRAQTPQGFKFEPIMRAHAAAAQADRDGFTDDAAVAEWDGLDVVVVEGAAGNIKLTSAQDMAIARRAFVPAAAGVVGSQEQAMEYRSGTGFDVHAFCEGSAVWLCGVEVPHAFALKGHSDADVAMHALTDAILGALGEGDIGQHFPPSEARWKGAASEIFLRDTLDRINARGGRLINADVTIICEAPRVTPHRDAMRARLAAILDVDVSRINVKGTTSEQLGFTGRREGIAAMAGATVALPADAPILGMPAT